MTPEQSAIGQIEQSFNDLIVQINQANARYDVFVKKYGQKAVTAFNANPANKNKLVRIDTAPLVAAENSAIDTQSLADENKYIMQDIETKKKLYADYEAYKMKVGSQSADAEYADLLKSGKDFATYLHNIYNSADQLAKDYSGDNSGLIQQRKDGAKKELDALTEDQKKALQQLLIEYATYEQKRAAIITAGDDVEKKLRAANANEQADNVKKETQQKLDSLTESQVKTLDGWKELFDGAAHLTETQAQKALTEVKKFLDDALKTGAITQTLYDALIAKADKARTAIANKDSADKLKAIGNSLQEIAGYAGQFDENLGHALDTIGKIVSGVGNIKSDLATLKDPDSGSLSKLTASLGIIGTAVNIVSAVVGLFSNSKAKAEQEQYNLELQQKAVEAINKSLQRQLELVKNIYGTDRITAYNKALADIKAAQDKATASLSNKLMLTNDNALNKEISKYNNGQSYNHYILTQQFIDSLTKSSDLAGKSLEDLQKLMDAGKLDVGTAAIVQSLVDLQQQAIDTQNAINEQFTGSSFDSLLSDVDNLFENFDTLAENSTKNFEKYIQEALLKGLETKYLDKQFQTWYDELTADLQPSGTLTADQIKALQDEYNAIIKNAGDQLTAIENATGIKFGSGDAATPTTDAAGKISAALTEDTAGEVLGTLHGIQLYASEIVGAVGAISKSNA